MFTTDRDLLILEPALLRDLGWAAQRTLNTTGSIAGATLTLASGSFEDAQIDAGSVVLFDGLAIEVVERLTATTATVSLLRAAPTSTPIPPPPASNRTVRAYTFAPQIAMVHRQVLAMIGIDPDGAGTLTEASVTNPRALSRLEALGALHLLYAGAAAPGAGGEPMAERAAMYRQRFAEERERVVAMIDTDADGIADASRRPTVFALVRG